MHDGRLYYACARGIMECMPFTSGILDHSFSSLISLTRNKLFAGFLRLPVEWAFCIDSDIGFTQQDFAYLMELQHSESADKPGEVTLDLAAYAPYARKDDSRKEITRGLGFARVHKSVISALYQTIAVPFQHEGIPMKDCFITGATASGGFLGEDSGFWWMCTQVGVVPRVERRCRLQHFGVAAYEIEPEFFATDK